MKANNFRYAVNNGWKGGYFNIYQARNGSIQIIMGDAHTCLTYQQVSELFLDVYSLIDFDYDIFLKYYNIQTKNERDKNFGFERVTHLLG